MRHIWGPTLASAIALMLGLSSACAAQSERRTFDITAQDLKYSLRDLANQAGLQLVVASEDISTLRAAEVHGEYTITEALTRLLAGTHLTADISDGTISIRQAPSPTAVRFGEDIDHDGIVVTGTLIRGFAPASPLLSISRSRIEAAGLHDLADVIRTIPQNFGGGQNAGIGLNVPENRGSGGGASTSLNLRGLGSDATLTLLNGHRLAYNVASQAIDLSTIPVSALERIEIVPDGSSALYGSDAVGGVANIILRRDYSGLITNVLQGGSTDGGNRQQQYDVLSGTRWSRGGAMLAYAYRHQTAVKAEQRDYAADRAPGLSLYPAISQHNLVGSAHQALSAGLELSVDGLFSRRMSRTQYALDLRGDIEANGSRSVNKNQSWVIAPNLRVSLPSEWQANLAASYGSDHSNYDIASYSNRVATFRQIGCYCNTSLSLEANANGDLISLPGGTMKLALGGGWRSNDFHGYRTDASQNIDVSQDAYFAFGELNVPVIGSGQSVAGIDRLTFTAAARVERYPGIDTVTTPKVGVILAPSPDFDLKGTWGKSFKAPTLYQRYNVTYATIYTAASRGGSGYAPGTTAILLSGGNADLKSERATTWSVSAAVHPRILPRALLEVSYYGVNYRDRVVTPITFPTLSLRDPAYADLVELMPSAARISAITGGNALLQSATGTPFNPASVVAIINNNSSNAARQIVRGVDGRATYDVDLGRDSQLGLEASASYIRIRQRLSPLQQDMSLAGTIFNIPHVRARGGATWRGSGVTLAAFVNYTGGVDDVRQTPSARVRAMTTADAALSYTFAHASWLLKNLAVSLSAQNVFDRHPSPIRATQPYETPYDSTNATPFGRVISVMVSKSW